jgi:hypothetical protein
MSLAGRDRVGFANRVLCPCRVARTAAEPARGAARYGPPVTATSRRDVGISRQAAAFHQTRRIRTADRDVGRARGAWQLRAGFVACVGFVPTPWAVPGRPGSAWMADCDSGAGGGSGTCGACERPTRRRCHLPRYRRIRLPVVVEYRRHHPRSAMVDGHVLRRILRIERDAANLPTRLTRWLVERDTSHASGSIRRPQPGAGGPKTGPSMTIRVFSRGPHLTFVA